MVNEVLACLRCQSLADSASPEYRADAVFADATLGTGGHTLAMLEAHPTCRVIAFDRDSDSMEFARRRLGEAGVLDRVTFVQSDFRNARDELKPYLENQKVGTDGRPITRIDGALIDAGDVAVASYLTRTGNLVSRRWRVCGCPARYAL